LMEVSAFMTEQLKEQLAVQREHDERMRSEFKADKQQMQQQLAAMEMKMEQQRVATTAQMEAQRLENDKLRAAAAETRVEAAVQEIVSAKGCVSEGQLETLQTRLDALHEAKLLTDDEVGALEDCVADYIDCCVSLNPAATEIGVAAERVKKMVGLSEGMGKDGMLARQLRRKFAAGQ
jgi:hypothetical protein